jgi:arginine utilization protein RocB
MPARASELPDFDPDVIRRRTEHLVSIRSVSPDPDAERRCGRALLTSLPSTLKRGEWLTPEGRPVIWALLRGQTKRTVVLLGHYDTVGVDEFAFLEGSGDTEIAFHPERLKAHLLDPAMRGSLPPPLVEDLELEAREPGSWLFGRGSLDMKSGLAVGNAVLASLARNAAELRGSVLFVATPDEECESAGMAVAAPQLVRLRESERLQYLGVLNLDYGLEPVGYCGVAGKLVAGFYVVGKPAHAADSLQGLDASQLAAAILIHATRNRNLIDRLDGRLGPPVAPLRLRDLKSRYDVQTAWEAVVELNLVIGSRPLEDTLRLLGESAARALTEVLASTAELRDWMGLGTTAFPRDKLESRVLTYPELRKRAGSDDDVRDMEGVASDARSATLARLRQLVRQAGLTGPAVIVHLLPPFYPRASPRDGPVSTALRKVLGSHGLEVLPFYPFISDASYVAWREDPIDAIRHHLPSLGREYHPPFEAAADLDLEVVNLGPWGRDAHGLFERVYGPYAFGRLPRLVLETITAAWGS